MKASINKIKDVIKSFKKVIIKEPVLFAASVCALISVFFVPPDRKYIEYIDFDTLLCLFGLMVSLKGIEREGIMTVISVKIASKAKNLRVLIFLLVFVCFFTSMLITNDVALIAFVPVTLFVFSVCGLQKYSAVAVILQTLAANIGSGLTPVGNPQNLFLFMRYGFTAGDFILTTLPFVLFGGFMLAVSCLFVPNINIRLEPRPARFIRKKISAAYCMMFIAAAASVFGFIPNWAAAAVIAATAFIIDKNTLLEIDYNLLLTFAVIFIFVGNIARIGWIYELISYMAARDCFLTAVVSSQFISNVPAAVMLSGFTDNAAELLVGVSVGGIGTLIASMASVISYRLCAAENRKGVKKYLLLFTVINYLFLLFLVCFVKIFFYIK